MKKKAKSKVCLPPRAELGSYLHTALRKVCDSTPTSLTWNLLNLDGINPSWTKYLDFAHKRLKGEKDLTKLWEHLKAASEDLEMDSRNAWDTTLYLSFRMFDQDDWERFSTYLFEY